MIFQTIPNLGAINKNTHEYVFYNSANKTDEYICPDCNKGIVFCKGEKIGPYFRHKVDTVNPCNYYDKPSESQIHKDAKMLIKTLLEKGILLSLVRNCNCCKKKEEFEIPTITETSSIHMEYRFEYNGAKIADVAYIDNNEILYIFEICNTHKTSSENRPEPWFEIDALTLINLINVSNLILSYKIPCIRSEKCEDCIIKEKTNIENKEKAVNILYEWINGNEIKPFVFDYDRFSKIEKNIKCEFINQGFDLIIYLDPNHEQGGWNRYCINLIYDFEEPYFIKEKEYTDLQIGVYYVNINWILSQTEIPKNIVYIACLDRYENTRALTHKKCKQCGNYKNNWVKIKNDNIISYICEYCKPDIKKLIKCKK